MMEEPSAEAVICSNDHTSETPTRCYLQMYKVFVSHMMYNCSELNLWGHIKTMDTQRTNLTSLEPATDTMEMEGMITDTCFRQRMSIAVNQ